MNKKLQRIISKKLTKLQELIENMQETQIIEPDDPKNWDNDTLYNLVEELKETLTLLENKIVKGKDDYGNPVIVEEGIIALIEEYQSEQKDDEDD